MRMKASIKRGKQVRLTMLARRILRRQYDFESRRSRLGARHARPQSIVVYMESDNPAEVPLQLDVDDLVSRTETPPSTLHHSFCMPSQGSLIKAMCEGSFRAGLYRQMYSEGLSLFRK